MSKSSRRSRSPSPSGALAGAPGVTLAEVHAHRVAVHIVVDGREQFIRGLASFESDVDLGQVLRVRVADAEGDFDFLIVESKWDGQVLPGQAVGCDYLLRLN